ncbi:transferase [Nostoc sp. UHCC 0870]|uniref:transferase n=1 Tax=Nostoc sp. UHCC 0870 TaxID=2914041 RepID=UPI001EE07F91|nr:transferase [Nostoc sp. UHCC 0870]UKO96380.1 transferase [Nostoc sp. UHCC 0870]
MSVPPLRLHNNFDAYISGEVKIHPSAVVAPGVILQAATNSKIIIGAGVCIGMGSILQVNEGTIEVEPGVNLGAGFLMVGQGKIGTNACIGSATTVFNCSVAPGLVVPPGSVLGDIGRAINITEPQPETSTDNAAATNTQKPKENENKVITSTTISAAAFVEVTHQSISVPESSTASENQPPAVEEDHHETDSTQTELSPEDIESGQTATESPNTFGTQIYGQGSIQRLLVTLFPHRQFLNTPVSDDSSE